MDDFVTSYWAFFLSRLSHAEIGILVTFIFHEVVYFGCYLPWFIVERVPSLRKYKLQVRRRAAMGRTGGAFL